MPEKFKKPLIRALKDISGHGGRFEPLELRRISPEAADQLVELGFAERGDVVDRRFLEWGYPIGYRLTRAGWTALNARRRYSYADLQRREPKDG